MTCYDCSYLIVRDGQAASALIVTAWEDEEGALLAFSMTHPGHQRQNLAAYLIRESLNALWERGIRQLRLVVTEGNLPAISLYRKLRFTPVAS